MHTYLAATILFLVSRWPEGHVSRWPQDGVPLFVVAFIGIAVGTISRWKFVVQWVNGVRGKNWPTVSATVESVDVAQDSKRRGEGYQGRNYVGTITYIYRNPEIQSGEFARSFITEDDARAWAESYRDSKVTVRVNPRDPSQSIVREEDV